MALPIQVVAVTLTFAAASGLAMLLGAANLGTAFTFGQIAFLLTAIFLLLRR